MLICGAWVYRGAQTTSAINIALIYAASPVLIALGAVLWLGERFSWRQAAGVLIAMAGVFHVVVKGQWLSLGQVQWVAGDGWIVLGEPMGWHHLMGAGLILPGIYLASRQAAETAEL